jgi:hypothetical protein
MSEDARPTTPELHVDHAATLPDDPVILQQMVLELLAALRNERHQNEQLQHRLDLLLRRLYGPRTEHFDPNQPLLIPDAFDPVTRKPASRLYLTPNQTRPQRNVRGRTAERLCPRISAACLESTS